MCCLRLRPVRASHACGFAIACLPFGVTAVGELLCIYSPSCSLRLLPRSIRRCLLFRFFRRPSLDLVRGGWFRRVFFPCFCDSVASVRFFFPLRRRSAARGGAISAGCGVGDQRRAAPRGRGAERSRRAGVQTDGGTASSTKSTAAARPLRCSDGASLPSRPVAAGGLLRHWARRPDSNRASALFLARSPPCPCCSDLPPYRLFVLHCSFGENDRVLLLPVSFTSHSSTKPP